MNDFSDFSQKKTFKPAFKFFFPRIQTISLEKYTFFGDEKLFVCLISKSELEFFWISGINFSSDLPKFHST